MNKTLIGRRDGEAVVIIDFDVDAGTIKINAPHGGSVEYASLDITLYLDGEDEIVWQGKSFHITKMVHEFFQSEYPRAILKQEYINADDWATKKDRKIKRPQQFMNNWLAKTRKGRPERGGVIY